MNIVGKGNWLQRGSIFGVILLVFSSLNIYMIIQNKVTHGGIS